MKEQSTNEQKYLKTEKISQGSYGVVYKGRNVQTGQIVAIKKFKNITNQGIPVSCVRQLHILNTLKQTYQQNQQNGLLRVLKLYDVYQHKDEILMVVEWMDQTLSDLLKQEGPKDAKKMFSDILKSVLQLHEHFIIHRDIKPANIMLTHATGILKVLDYGMAKQIDFQEKPMTNEVGSLFYRAPQLLLGSRHYDFSIDIWSLGCVFYQILTKKILFKGQSQLDQLKKIFLITGTPQIQNQILTSLMKKYNLDPVQKNWTSIQKQLSQQQAQILKNLLNLDPKQRPTVSQILNYKYFSTKS